MGWIERLTKGRIAMADAPGARAEPSGEAVARDGRPLDAGEVRDALAQHVVEASEGKLERDAIEAGAPLFDHGYVDSLTAVSLLETIRARYGVEVSEVDLVGRLNTIDALARHIAEAGTHAS